jgi:hypothetical protein
VTGLGSARSQTINFAAGGGNYLYTVNGVDPPQIYNGTVWSVPVITGLSSADIIGVNAHKNRLWFTIVNSSDAYYLPVASIAGAAVKFPLGGLWNQGGFLMAMGTWSIDGGTGLDDYAVFISSWPSGDLFRDRPIVSDDMVAGWRVRYGRTNRTAVHEPGGRRSRDNRHGWDSPAE